MMDVSSAGYPHSQYGTVELEGTGAVGGGRTAAFVVAVVDDVVAFVVVADFGGLGVAATFVMFGAGFGFGGSGRLYGGGGGGSSSGTQGVKR